MSWQAGIGETDWVYYVSIIICIHVCHTDVCKQVRVGGSADRQLPRAPVDATAVHNILISRANYAVAQVTSLIISSLVLTCVH